MRFELSWIALNFQSTRTKLMIYSYNDSSFKFLLMNTIALKSMADTSLVAFDDTLKLKEKMKTKNFYIIASASNDPALRVEISGPYRTQQSAEEDLTSAVKSAKALDPCAKDFQYTVCQLDSDKPGIIQHMAENRLTSLRT